MGTSDIHSAFRLNGKNYSQNELLRFANEISSSKEEHEQQLAKFILEWFDDNDFIALTTSGTTGTPKVIYLKKQAMINSALATAEFFDLAAGCKTLHCLSVQYIAGKMMFVRAIALGWDLDIVKPDALPLDGNTTAYDFAAMVPLQVEKSLDNLHRIKKIIIGGAKLNSTLVNSLKKLPVEIYETYGMTETITHIAAKRVQESAFSVLPGIAISTDDRNCLVIAAPRLSDSKIVTNDVVEIISGDKFVWLGRADNVINSGGVKLFPERIEEKLSDRIPNRFFVIGRPDDTLGEKLVLVIEGQPFEIGNSIFDNLDKYEKPREIVFVPKFTETETGKIKRAASIQ